MMAAAALMLGLNWVLAGVRSPVLTDDMPQLAGTVVAMLLLVPVIMVSSRRGMVETTGVVLILFVSFFAIGAAVVTHQWVAGGALNLALCGLLSVLTIFVWPRTWHFVVGTLILLTLPTLVMLVGSPDDDAIFRGLIFASNCLLLNVAVFVLVSRSQVREARIGQITTWEARHDGLTALLNRKVWLRLAGELLVRSRNHGTTFWVLILDLDHFKSINDLYGHAAGDGVLVRLSAILAEAVEEIGRPAFAGRIGGDEFALAISGAGQVEIDALIQRLDDRYRITNGFDDLTSLSVGTAYSTGDETLNDLVERADRAMYAAKLRVRPEGSPPPPLETSAV
jgi:diguanylate cyclase (GGDEF)-like protein